MPVRMCRSWFDSGHLTNNKTKSYENKNDIIKASAISTGADRGVLLCSITDSGFTSIAGVISAVKDKLPGKDHKKMIFEIRNDGRNEYGRYNNCGGKYEIQRSVAPYDISCNVRR